MTDVEHLVHFDSPPITEVVAAVAFEPIEDLTAAHLGAFWSESLRPEFPNSEERPAYDPPIEAFDEGPSAGAVKLSVSSATPPVRLWLLSSEGQELIQVQNNWFACNWRRVSPRMEYGHWQERRDSFQKNYDRFQAFLESTGMGPVEPVQCEVTYINHIRPTRHWSTPRDVGNVIRFLDFDRLGRYPDTYRFTMSFEMPDHGEGPSGRLRVTTDSALHKESGEPAVVLNLTARGAPIGDGLLGVLAFLDAGRKEIVETFQQITSSEMQSDWEIER